MPTTLDRVQCLLQPEPYSAIRTLAKAERKSLSHMCSELIDEALKLPKYRELLEESREAGSTVPVKEDTRTTIRQRQRRSDKYIEENLSDERSELASGRSSVNQSSTIGRSLSSTAPLEPERITRRRSSTKPSTSEALTEAFKKERPEYAGKMVVSIKKNTRTTPRTQDLIEEQEGIKRFDEALAKAKQEEAAKLARIKELEAQLQTL